MFNDNMEDGRLCSFYHNPLKCLMFMLVELSPHVHKAAKNGFCKSLADGVKKLTSCQKINIVSKSAV